MASAATPAFPSTKETTNYARLCRLLVDVGSQALRETFDAIHPPVGLHTVLGRHPEHAILQSLEKKRVLNPTQLGKLYPTTPSSVSSADFDITLLMVLLRNICGLLPPSTGWDRLPPSTDMSKQANIARLKYYRNTVYGHASQAFVDDATFNSYWQDISKVIVGLAGAGYRAAISKLKNDCIHPETEEHYRKLLKQWKQDEDNIKETIREIEDNVRQVKTKLEEIGEILEELLARQEETKEQDDFDPECHQVIDDIRQLYKNREGRLAPFSWCEQFHFFGDIYTRLKVIYRKNTRGTATDRVVTMSEIFNPHEECEEPRTVLIEGKPGMGKTTYCKKVVFDWATRKHASENCFTNFLMVLLIKCRDVQSSLWEAIDDQLLPRDVDDEQRKRFFDFIRYNQSKVLLVLDGLDEVSEGKLPLFSEIIQGRVLPKCRVIVTARHEAGVKVRKFCDTLLEVEGFTAKDAQSFITRFFRKSPQLAQKLIERLIRNENLKDMAANPLNTALFCLVCEEFDGAFPESRTVLFMLIVECVLRRYRAKKELPEIGEEIVQLYESQLKHLGTIAFRGLLGDNLDFDEKELGKHKSSDLPGLGFLSVQPTGSKLRPSTRYAFLHKSFQEWFAAYHLSCQLQNKEISTDNIAADTRYRHQLKEVLLFTFGMLAQRCEKTAITLMKSIATQLNQETERELAGGLKIAVECINECKDDGSNLDLNLAASFGSALQVQSVALRSGEINDDGAVILANVLKGNRTVTNLNLSRNNIGDDGATGLAEALKSNVSLKELNLSRNKIGGVGAASLGEALNGETSLEVLDLRENKIGEAGFKALAEGLKSNSCLTKLSLFNNSAGDTGATALAKGLKSNSSLKELYLFSNDIGDDGAAALADALSCSSCLTLLYLCRNRIGDSGAAALALCLRDNASLKELNLSQNNIGDAGVTTLADCLQHNTSLKKLYLNDNKISNVGVAADCFREITKVVLVW